MQPALFPFETADAPAETPRAEAGRLLVRKLNRLRRSLPEAEAEFDAYLARAVRDIRCASSMDDEARRSRILAAIERSCAHAFDEIADDVDLPNGQVRPLLASLVESGTVEAVPRLTIGGSQKQILYFSKINPCPCVSQ